MLEEPEVRAVHGLEDERGFLGVVERIDWGFDVQRIYWIKGAGPGVTRGQHAHKSLRQAFIAMNGSVQITLEGSGSQVRSFTLEVGNMVLIPPGYWRELTEFSLGAVVLVLADQPFDEADYIRDIHEFREWISRGPA